MSPRELDDRQAKLYLGVDRRGHGDLGAAPAWHRAGLLDGLGQHAERVVKGPLRLVQYVLAVNKNRFKTLDRFGEI